MKQFIDAKFERLGNFENSTYKSKKAKKSGSILFKIIFAGLLLLPVSFLYSVGANLLGFGNPITPFAYLVVWIVLFLFVLVI